MTVGVIAGVSVGLALLILVFLIVGCKCARMNKKEDEYDVSKEELLQFDRIQRHKKSQYKRRDKGDYEYEKTTPNNDKPSSRRKSVTFFEDHLENNRDEKAVRPNNTIREPKRRLLNEYLDSSDKSRSNKRSVETRDSYYKDRVHNGRNNQPSNRTVSNEAGVHRYRDDRIPNAQISNNRELAEVKRSKYSANVISNSHISIPHGVTVKQIVEEHKQHTSQSLDLERPNTRRTIPQGITVKQIVEEHKRSSRQAIENERNKKDNQNNGQYYEYNSTKIDNTSSGRRAGQEKLQSKDLSGATYDRLLTQPQEPLPEFSSATPEYQRQSQISYARLTNHMPRKEGVVFDNSPDTWHASNNTLEKHDIASQSPSRKHNQFDRDHHSEPVYARYHTNLDTRHTDYSEEYGADVHVPDKRNQYIEATKDGNKSNDQNSFSETLATWANQSETHLKIPRTSTRTPYRVHSTKAPDAVTVQVPTSSVQRPNVHYVSMGNKGFAASQMIWHDSTPPQQPKHITSEDINSKSIQQSQVLIDRSDNTQETQQPSLVSGVLDMHCSPDVTLAAPGIQHTQRSLTGRSPVMHTQRSPKSSVNTDTQHAQLSNAIAQSSPPKQRSITGSLPVTQQSTPGKQTSPYGQMQQDETGSYADKQESPNSPNKHVSPQSSPIQKLPPLENSPKYTEHQLNADMSVSPTANSTYSVPKPYTSKQQSPTINNYRPVKSPIHGVIGKSNAPLHSRQTQHVPLTSSNESLPPPPTPIEEVSNFTFSKTLPQPPTPFQFNALDENTINLDRERLVKDVKTKDSVDSMRSTSDFNPGEASTPKQSATEVPEDNTERSNRSVLHSMLQRRRGRIGSSVQDVSNIYENDEDSIWDQSISPIRKSSSLDGKAFKPIASEKSDKSSVENEQKGQLTEKINTARNLRDDPDINALLSDIKARRIPSSQT